MSDLHDLAAAYALDALDPDERAEFAAHLTTCADCRREVAEFEATAGSLADAAAVAPPPDLKSSVLAAISGVAQEPVGVGTSEPAADQPVAEVVQLADRRPRRYWLAGAAAAILAVVAIGVVLGTRSSAVTADDVFAAADVEIVALPGDDATVRVAWSRELDHVVVDGEALPSPGAGNVYELWAIVDGAPVPAGLIAHDGGALEAVLDVDELAAADVAAWGVTIEPAGGSETPTLPILYFAEV